MAVENVVDFAVHASINGVDQPIALATAGMLKKSRRKNPLAGGGENAIDRIVHAARHDRLDAASIRPAAENVRGFSLENLVVGERVGLLGECALAPVNPAIRSQVRPVQIIGAASEGFARKPFHPLISHAIAVGVRQFPDTGRAAHVQ